MRAALAFLLGLAVACPAALASPTPAAVSKDVCPICGHACCCPEACAAQLKKLKDHQRDLDVGPCSNGASVCRMSAHNDRAPINLHTAERPREQGAQLATKTPALPKAWLSRTPDVTALLSASPALSIPLPPPRLTA